MSAKAVFWATDKKVGDPVAKYVLMILCQMADRQYQCWPKAANLVKKTELGDRTVRRAISYLIKNKLIHSMPWFRSTDSGSTSNVYTVLVDDENALDTPVMEPLRDRGKPSQDTDTPLPNRPPAPCLLDHPPVAAQASQESKRKGSNNFDLNTSLREGITQTEGFKRLPSLWKKEVLKQNQKYQVKVSVSSRSDLDGFVD